MRIEGKLNEMNVFFYSDEIFEIIVVYGKKNKSRFLKNVSWFFMIFN